MDYRETKQPDRDQQLTAPVAIHTKFGSAISAPKWPVENSDIHNTTMTDGSISNLTFFQTLDGMDLAHFDMKSLFSLDNIGIECLSKDVWEFTADEADAVKLVDGKTRFDKERGCYVTGLPWKLPTTIKDTNQESTEQLTEKFHAQLQANPEKARGWCDSYVDTEAKGFCQPLTEEELKDDLPNVHYI